MKVQTAIFWYADEATYYELQQIMDDREGSPFHYAVWRRDAEQAYRTAQASGADVMKVNVVPREFQAWCAKNKLKAYSSTRAQYAVEKMEEAKAEKNKCDANRL